jgi:drug/metabolite transporter (DMT)-like permease
LASIDTAANPSRLRVKTRTQTETLVLTLAVVLLNGFGNLALAWGMKHRDAVSANPVDYIRALFDPFVALGVGLLILWLLTRMALMSWADLSFVVPMTAVGYLLSAALGHFFLGEQISPMRWTATLLIVVGIALVGSTPHKSKLSHNGDPESQQGQPPS